MPLQPTKFVLSDATSHIVLGQKIIRPVCWNPRDFPVPIPCIPVDALSPGRVVDIAPKAENDARFPNEAPQFTSTASIHHRAYVALTTGKHIEYLSAEFCTCVSPLHKNRVLAGSIWPSSTSTCVNYPSSWTVFRQNC